MDVSPIQRMAISANQAVRPPAGTRPAPAVAQPAQAAPANAENNSAGRTRPDSTQVVVAWHPASLGYVTRVVDHLSGSVVYQSPPESVLDMVEAIVARLEKDAA